MYSSISTVRVEIFDINNRWLDVSERRAIIYGAGQGCFEIINQYEIPRIEYVVDSDLSLHGKKRLLLGEFFQICTPDILKDLNSKQYYIIVSSIKYQKDIVEKIKSVIGMAMPICRGIGNIRVSYYAVEDLFYMDKVMHEKIRELNLSYCVKDIIKQFYKVANRITDVKNITYFEPIKDGHSKLIFIFGDYQDKWVFSYPGKLIGYEPREFIKKNPGYISQRINCKFKHIYENDITIYEDLNGISVQYYSNEMIDVSNEKIMRDIFQKLRKLHSEKYKELPDVEFEDNFYYFWKDLVAKKHGFEKAERLYILDTIGDNIVKSIRLESEKKVIHGDFISDNVIMFNGEICFIDWEFLGIGDPMIDISYFNYSIYEKRYELGEISFKTMCEEMHKKMSDITAWYYENENSDEKLFKAINYLAVIILRKIYMVAHMDIETAINMMTEYVKIYNEDYVDRDTKQNI